MSAIVQQILTQVKLDAVQAIADAKELAKSIGGLGRELDDATDPLNELRNGIEGVGDQLVFFGDQGARTRGIIEGLINPAKRLKTAQQQVAQAQKDVNHVFNQMRDTFTIAKLDLANMVGGIDNLNSILAVGSRVADVFVAGIKILTGVALAAAAVLGGALVVAIKKYIAASRPAQKASKALKKSFSQMATAIGDVIAGQGRLKTYMDVVAGLFRVATKLVVHFKDRLRGFTVDVVQAMGTAVEVVLGLIEMTAGPVAFFVDLVFNGIVDQMRDLDAIVYNSARGLYLIGAISKESFLTVATASAEFKELVGRKRLPITEGLLSMTDQIRGLVRGFVAADAALASGPMGKLLLNPTKGKPEVVKEIELTGEAIKNLFPVIGQALEFMEEVRVSSMKTLNSRDGIMSGIGGFITDATAFAKNAGDAALVEAKRAQSPFEVLMRRGDEFKRSLLDIGIAAGAAFGALAVGAGSSSEIFAGALQGLGAMAIQYGSFLILTGSGLSLIPGFEKSVGAVAAGVGLVALGGALQGGAGLIAGGGGSSSGGGGGALGGVGTAPDLNLGQRQDREPRQTTLVLKVGREVFARLITEEVDTAALLGQFAHIPVR